MGAPLRRQNHWFDALYNACAPVQGVGVRLVEETKPEPAPQQQPPQRTIEGRVPGWMGNREFPEWVGGR